MSPEVVIPWIESIRGELSIQDACALLGLPRSTYYRWKATYEASNIDHITETIRQLCIEHKYRYGYRKVTALLRVDQVINHKRVQRIMQREGLQCRVRVKKRKPTGQPSLYGITWRIAFY
ncbi:IS3 family transposase [Paenibacillus sp. NEAU-GSW1]|uniref:IS3 family transposase n=1 Tax=Paenibacillus sp. NEAU-GSW1 TaxID=2682486 RepID=UPI0012E13D67|nr:IS3 family transposase [Paenibacillus sp. NEAU-GSW1]